MIAPKSPGPLLRSLRLARRLSQEELAHRAAVSPRHLSCLETGRAYPSRAMLLVLGSALNLPLRDRNVLLIAAGFAPVFEQLSWDDPALERVRQAVAHILRHHEPHPAMLLDRFHNVLRLNDGAARLFSWTGVRFPANTIPNAVRAIFDASYGLRQCIVGFDGLAHEALARLRTEADVDPGLRDFVAEMETLRGTTGGLKEAGADSQVALPIHFRRGATNLRYFMTITTLGTPLDVTAQELRIESYFPMDAETEAFDLQADRSAGDTLRSASGPAIL
jgi:transcriptional regulator with XRE-family HTH domain